MARRSVPDRVVAAGYGGAAHRLPDDDRFAPARYETDGALDRSLGKSGRAMAEIDDPIYDDYARGLALIAPHLDEADFEKNKESGWKQGTEIAHDQFVEHVMAMK